MKHNLKKEGMSMRRTQLVGLLCLLVWCFPTAPFGQATFTRSTLASPDPARPRVVAMAASSCANDSTIGNQAGTIAISDTLAFLGDGQALTILDVSDAARPTCRSHLALPPNSRVMAIEVRGNYAYLALNNASDSDVGLQI